MTVPTTSNRVSYACDGVTTVFAFTFKAYDKADLRVILGGPAGSETILTLDVDYSVSVSAPGPGGTVTLIGSYGSTPPASGYTLTIYRELAMTQLIDLVHGDAMPPDTLEEGYDRAVMLIQQLSERIGRSILLPVSSSVTGLTLPAPDPGKILKWNDGGDGFDNVNLADLSMQAVNDYWAGVLAASGTTVADALAAMGLAPSLATFTLPDNVTISSYIKTLLDDANAATARNTLGLGGSSPGIVKMVRTGSGTWAVYAPDGSAIDISSSTTDGLQEAINYARLYGYDLFVYGGGVKTGGSDDSVITCTTGLVLPSLYRHSIVISGALIDFTSAVTGDGLFVDTLMRCNLIINGSIRYRGNAAAVRFKPTNADPHESVTGIVQSNVKIDLIDTVGGTNPRGVIFDQAYASTTNCKFVFSEIRGNNVSGSTGVLVTDAAGGREFNSNWVDCLLVHNQTNVGVQIGQTSGAGIANNVWNLHIIAESGVTMTVGLDTFASWDTYFGIVVGDPGTISTGIRFRNGSTGCINLIGQVMATTKVLDESTHQNRWAYGHDQLAFSVHKNGTGQTIPSGTPTKVTWAAKALDPFGKFSLSNHRWVPGVKGVYRLSAGIYYTAMTDAAAMNLMIYRNGSILKQIVGAARGTAGQGLGISVLVEVTSDSDYFELYVQQGTGGDKTLSGGADLTYFEGEKII